ncbi:claudin-11-like [Xiphophorus maculatus]|uniref:Claudin-11 n=2 Tax=Xiphophorus TaxID=8082 RepID=M4ANF9_XIPMA|nr:claudin-11-like [Xiphophorus maculatus]XP_027856426.1 claudin-11-like [Xiphophorus couchianus]XP_032402914.1 claudin-11 [Xiphophorus hellerii]
MANSCLQLCGFLLSSLGWLGIVIATSTNDWVTMCKYGVTTCKKLDELQSKGPWEECVISTALYHCVSYTQILELPAYIQTTRALMILGSILGLPAVILLLMSMPCISIGNDAQSAKNKRAILGGVLMVVVALCALVPTIWFPIGANQELGLMSFGFSLYAGWVGTVFCLLGGVMLMCSSDSSTSSPRSYQDNNHYYYSKHGGGNLPAASSNHHAKSAHV